jgi:hypothetical protein
MASNGGIDFCDLNTATSLLFPEDPTWVRKHNYGDADNDMQHYFNVNNSGTIRCAICSS